jgi:hypothetical protein
VKVGSKVCSSGRCVMAARIFSCGSRLRCIRLSRLEPRSTDQPAIDTADVLVSQTNRGTFFGHEGITRNFSCFNPAERDGEKQGLLVQKLWDMNPKKVGLAAPRHTNPTGNSDAARVARSCKAASPSPPHSGRLTKYLRSRAAGRLTLASQDGGTAAERADASVTSADAAFSARRS